MSLTTRLAQLLDTLNDAAGAPRISPVDPKAPVGTQRQRIAAHNTILDEAKPFADRICGDEGYNARNGRAVHGPCVLKLGHTPSDYRDTANDSSDGHVDAATLHRAKRYLIHSEPDAGKRA